MLPLLIGEGAPPDPAMSIFLQSAISPIGPSAATAPAVDGFSIRFGDTRFSCFRAAAARIGFDGGSSLRLIFPYQGHIEVRSDRAVDDLHSEMDVALYRLPLREIAAREHASFVCVDLDLRRLFNSALVCAGVDEKVFFVRLEHALRARCVRLQDHSVGFAELRHFFRHLSFYAANSDLGLSLGLEELFYRYVVLLVFHRDMFGKRPREAEDNERLAALQDAIYANPSRRFSLPEMSQSVGMSARSLQKLVMSAFGVTPIEWQIGLRLDAARARLIRGDGKVSITALAGELGFSTPSRFAEQYRRKFGVTPRQDLLRMRNNPASNANSQDKAGDLEGIDIF